MHRVGNSVLLQVLEIASVGLSRRSSGEATKEEEEELVVDLVRGVVERREEPPGSEGPNLPNSIVFETSNKDLSTLAKATFELLKWMIVWEPHLEKVFSVVLSASEVSNIRGIHRSNF
ncbi:unnamed protein product [Lupinus luteus]|uniref:Uncharacterized protein n=1 Tax=Lupinus luteus TaxID=3873 RepID=A0AAV1WNL8_LUPLU